MLWSIKNDIKGETEAVTDQRDAHYQVRILVLPAIP